MNEYRFDEISIGQKEEFSVEISDGLLEKFKTITGDINPLHTDVEYAKSKGYNDRIAYGMLTASFLSTLAGVYIPGKFSLINKEELSFLKPVFVGDRLRVVGEVIAKNDKYRFITIKIVILNQTDTRVGLGKMEISVTE